MGETIDQTRLEIAAERADLEATADHLRDALDLRKRFRENPGVVIGIGAAAVFLVAGGPRRVARLLRGTIAPHAAEQAYEALPASMQAWVTALAGEAGAKSGKVRDELVEELRRWRRDPIKDRKARKELARQMVDGPPGPKRTAWNAAEAALTLVAAALTRKAIERFLTDEPARKPSGEQPGEPAEARAPAPEAAAPRASVSGPEGYSGWSDRDKPAGD